VLSNVLFCVFGEKFFGVGKIVLFLVIFQEINSKWAYAAFTNFFGFVCFPTILPTPIRHYLKRIKLDISEVLDSSTNFVKYSASNEHLWITSVFYLLE